MNNVVSLRRAIVIPTHEGHFSALLRFLRSYQNRVTDSAAVPICIIVSNAGEEEALRGLLGKNQGLLSLPLQIHSIQAILERNGVSAESAQKFHVSAFANKYSYQSVKKFYGVIDSQADQVLVLDSEALLLKQASINELFDNYFAAPFVFRSETDNEFLRSVNEASLSLVSPRPISAGLASAWIFEYPAWFFDRRIVTAFVAAVVRQHGQSLFEVLCKTPNVFEVVSYHWFIHLHQDHWPTYRFINIGDLLEKYLGKEPAAHYLAGYEGARHGILEHMLLGLNRDNFQGLLNLADALRIGFVRCERRYAGGDIRLVRKFLGAARSIRVAACSDEADLFVSEWWRRIMVRTAKMGGKMKRFSFSASGRRALRPI